jgi:hypothetical protein
MGWIFDPDGVPSGRLRRWSYVLGAAALYAAMGYAAWQWAGILFPTR